MPHFAIGFISGVVLLFFFLSLTGKSTDLPTSELVKNIKSKPVFKFLSALVLAALMASVFYLNSIIFSNYIFWDLVAFLLIFTAVYDLVFRLIPIYLLVVLVLLVFGAAYFFSDPLPILYSLTGAAVVAGVIAVMYLVTKGRGIGEADIFLGAVIGALFGWTKGLLVFSAANFLGLAVVAPLILIYGKKRMRQIPLILFMVMAIFLEWYIGYTELVLSYLSLS